MSRIIVVSVSLLLLLAAVAGYWVVKDESGPDVSVSQPSANGKASANGKDSGTAGAAGQSPDANAGSAQPGAVSNQQASTANQTSAPSPGGPGSLDVQQLVELISLHDKSQNRVVMTALVKLGEQHTEDMVSALLSVTERVKQLQAEIVQPSLGEPERAALVKELEEAGWRQIQLVTLLGHRTGPGVIDALIYVAGETYPQSTEQISILTSLASQGPSQKSRDYFLSLINSKDSSFYQKKGAIGYLSENADAADLVVVDKLLKETSDQKLLGTIIYWASHLKDRNEMLAVIDSYLAGTGTDRNSHYLPLFALAKIATPAEFETIVSGKPLNAWDKASGLRITKFNHAALDEKERLIPRLLSSRYIEEKQAAIRYMLENNKAELLRLYGMGHLHRNFASRAGGTIHVDPGYKRLIRLSGYDVRVASGQLVIESLRAP